MNGSLLRGADVLDAARGSQLTTRVGVTTLLLDARDTQLLRRNVRRFRALLLLLLSLYCPTAAATGSRQLPSLFTTPHRHNVVANATVEDNKKHCRKHEP